MPVAILTNKMEENISRQASLFRQCLLLALNVIHAAAKVSSQSDQQRTNCAVGLHWLRSD
jgi:hypothetical protein